MKVEELIEKLEKLNKNATVGIVYEDMNVFGLYERSASTNIKVYAEEGENELVMISFIDLSDIKSVKEI